MSKKILKIWPFWVKGLKYHDHHLADFMTDDDVETIFVCPNHYLNEYDFSLNESAHSGYKTFFLDHIVISNKALPYKFRTFVRFLKETNPDVVHIFGLSNFTTIFAILAVFSVKYKGQIFFNDHSDPNERKSSFKAQLYYGLFRLFYVVFIRNKYTVIVPDLATGKELQWRYGKSISDVIKVIPLGYDDKTFSFSPRLERTNKRLILGFAGKIVPAKRLEVFLDVLDQFPEEKIYLKIAGISPEKPTQYQNELMMRFGRAKFKNFEFFPFCSTPEDLAEFYRTIDVAVFPGSISITTFEANGTGCPVLLFNSYDGLEHRVSDGRGFLYNHIDELLEYIGRYLGGNFSSVDIRRKLSENSKQYGWRVLKRNYYKEYGWHEMVESSIE